MQDASSWGMMGAMDDREGKRIDEMMVLMKGLTEQVQVLAGELAEVAELVGLPEPSEPAKPLAPTSCTECGDSRLEADTTRSTYGPASRGETEATLFLKYPCLRCEGCGETFTLASVLMGVEDAKIAIKDWGAPENLDGARSPLVPVAGETFSNTAVKNPPQPSADAMRKR